MSRFLPLALQSAGLTVLIILLVPGCQGNHVPTAHQELPTASIERQIEKLGSLEGPQGITPELWEQLTTKLAQALKDEYIGKGRKLVTSAPTSETSQATLSIEPGTLTWGYYNQAEYDQNGEVNLADLTSIALNFGATGPFEANSAQAVVDGDNNTEINLVDITPIVVSFLNSARGGYNIYQSLDPADAPTTNSSPNGSTAVFVGNVALSSGSGDKATQRLQFSFDILDPVVDAYYWVRPTDGVEDGQPAILSGLTHHQMLNQRPLSRQLQIPGRPRNVVYKY